MSLENDRRPVWIALSELFLDTDVTLFYDSIARVLVESPYPIEKLRKILFDEVAPVLQGNVLSPAGEGAGFDEEWLVAEAAKRVGKSPLLRMPFVRRTIEGDWEQVAALVADYRAQGGKPKPLHVA